MTAQVFSYRISKQGDVTIDHHGRHAATLRGRAAERFLSRLQDASEEESQLAMAKATGNYKRGNERQVNPRK